MLYLCAVLQCGLKITTMKKIKVLLAQRRLKGKKSTWISLVKNKTELVFHHQSAILVPV